MPELELAEIAAAVSGTVNRAGRDRRFRNFQFDTRAMKGDALFFAMRTPKADGHDHVKDLAVLPGAGAVVRKDFAAVRASMPLVRVDDPLQAAQKLAAYVRQKYRSLKYVGITGSAGKTTTKEFVFQILSHKYRCFRSPQNWNNWIGLPFSLLQMSGREEVAIFELAMSDPGIGEIDRLAEIVQPDIAVLLNVFPVHLEFLGSLANAARAKGEILGHLAADGCAFVNGDEPLLRRVAAGCPTPRSRGSSTASAKASTLRICEPMWRWMPRTSNRVLARMWSMALRASSRERPNFEPWWPVAIAAIVGASTPGMTRSSTAWGVP